MNKQTVDRLIRILTVVFLLLVVATFAAYFALKTSPAVFITLGFLAIGVRVVTYILRHFNR